MIVEDGWADHCIGELRLWEAGTTPCPALGLRFIWSIWMWIKWEALLEKLKSPGGGYIPLVHCIGHLMPGEVAGVEVGLRQRPFSWDASTLFQNFSYQDCWRFNIYSVLLNAALGIWGRWWYSCQGRPQANTFQLGCIHHIQDLSLHSNPSRRLNIV